MSVENILDDVRYSVKITCNSKDIIKLYGIRSVDYGLSEDIFASCRDNGEFFYIMSLDGDITITHYDNGDELNNSYKGLINIYRRGDLSDKTLYVDRNSAQINTDKL